MLLWQQAVHIATPIVSNVNTIAAAKEGSSDTEERQDDCTAELFQVAAWRVTATTAGNALRETSP